MAGIMTAAELGGRTVTAPPSTTALGALLGHITGDALADDYQPMNINFGLFAPLDEKVHKKSRKAAMTGRARTDLNSWNAAQAIAPHQHHPGLGPGFGPSPREVWPYIKN